MYTSNFNDGEELNEHTPSVSILFFRFLPKMFVRHPLKLFVNLNVIDACF
jgi:hypothetical protein